MHSLAIRSSSLLVFANLSCAHPISHYFSPAASSYIMYVSNSNNQRKWKERTCHTKLAARELCKKTDPWETRFLQWLANKKEKSGQQRVIRYVSSARNIPLYFCQDLRIWMEMQRLNSNKLYWDRMRPSSQKGSGTARGVVQKCKSKGLVALQCQHSPLLCSVPAERYLNFLLRHTWIFAFSCKIFNAFLAHAQRGPWKSP